MRGSHVSMHRHIEHGYIVYFYAYYSIRLLANNREHYDASIKIEILLQNYTVEKPLEI